MEVIWSSLWVDSWVLDVSSSIQFLRLYAPSAITFYLVPHFRMVKWQGKPPHVLEKIRECKTYEELKVVMEDLTQPYGIREVIVWDIQLRVFFWFTKKLSLK